MSSDEITIHKATIIQVIPLAQEWMLAGDGDEYPIAMVALVELVCSSEGFPEWTGRQIFPVDSDMEVRGIPGDGFYLSHALGDNRHGMSLRRLDKEDVWDER